MIVLSKDRGSMYNIGEGEQVRCVLSYYPKHNMLTPGTPANGFEWRRTDEHILMSLT